VSHTPYVSICEPLDRVAIARLREKGIELAHSERLRDRIAVGDLLELRVVADKGCEVPRVFVLVYAYEPPLLARKTLCIRSKR